MADDPFIAAPDAATRLSTIAHSLIPRPPPPYASGIATPSQPPSAIAE
jgi:hypothetical protein